MFKFLKEKLKSWTRKIKKEETAKKKRKTERKKEKSEKQTLQVKQKSFFPIKKKLTEEKFNELFEELELILLQNNVAYEVVEKIKEKLAEKLIGENMSEINLEEELKKAIESVLINPPDFIEEIRKTLSVKRPFVICFVGINGSGKTTTIAKIAYLLKKEKFSVCFAAADTFRAASIEQIQEHANNLKVHLIKKGYNADPASVAYDAIQYAKKHYIDVVLIDTAGRMQNQDSLMREIEKIVRVNKPDMKIFVGESITGNDAIEQAKKFNETIDISGIILSKADVDEKGGTAISVSYVTKKPILFLGTGQKYEDLKEFKKENLIKQIFG